MLSGGAAAYPLAHGAVPCVPRASSPAGSQVGRHPSRRLCGEPVPISELGSLDALQQPHVSGEPNPSGQRSDGPEGGATHTPLSAASSLASSGHRGGTANRWRHRTPSFLHSLSKSLQQGFRDGIERTLQKGCISPCRTRTGSSAVLVGVGEVIVLARSLARDNGYRFGSRPSWQSHNADKRPSDAFYTASTPQPSGFFGGLRTGYMTVSSFPNCSTRNGGVKSLRP